MYYDNDADPAALGRPDRRDHRLRQPGPRPRAEPARVGRRRRRRAGRRARKSRALAEEAGLRVADVADAVTAADVIMILVPDTAQKAVYDAEIAPNLRPGQLLMFAHGFNIQFERIEPPARRRRRDGRAQGPRPPRSARVYRAGRRRAGAVRGRAGRDRHRPRPGPRLRPGASARPAPASSRRPSRRRPRPTCSASRPSCAAASRRWSRRRSRRSSRPATSPSSPTSRRMHELKLIVDLMYRGGLNFMRFSVSDTAEYGDYVSGPRIIDDRVRATMKEVLARDPGRHVRRPLDRRERGRPAELQAAARSRPRPPDRAGRRPRCAPRCRSSTRSRSRPARPRRRRRHRRAEARDERRAVPRPAGPFVPAGSVRIFDTTLRDGEQAPGAGLTAAEKLEVARQLARLKVDVIEAGFPAASPGDFEAVRRIAQETRGGIAVAALARCKDGDPQRAIEAIKVAERPHLHVFIATSDIHLKHKLRIDRETALAEAVRWVALRPRGAGPRRRDRVLAPRTPRAPTSTSCCRSTRRSSRPAPPRSTSPTPSATPSRPSSARSSGGSSTCVGDAGHGLASTATTTWASPRPTRWPRSRPARARSRSRSTASASAPATRRSRRS